jgi:hypothetical protein
MTTTEPSFAAPRPSGAGPTARNDARATAAPRQRDPRLDFFRGLAMFIILIAHIPNNGWTWWIPARFGWSDATEIFVFCSGMASAVAFGATFARAGFWMGTARTVFRIWQVYWAHIGLFLFIAALFAGMDIFGDFERCYTCGNLRPFFEDPAPQLVGLMTLTYVPNYFDILPMYLVILALMPVMIALARIHPYVALGASVTLWFVAQLDLLDLSADPWRDRPWFFNPFGWQLIFFTGFAFMAGWLPKPPVSRSLAWTCAAFLLLTMPLSSPHGVTVLGWVSPTAQTWAMEAYPHLAEFRTKTQHGILRYLHFLALAYLMWLAAGEGGRRLRPGGHGPLATAWRWIVAQVTKVGQQSLAIFVVSMALSQIIGFTLDEGPGRTPATEAIGNLAGIAILIGAAYLVAWFKAHPWRMPRA